MGAHPYWYITPWEDDPQVALAKLREREFRAGRYNPAMSIVEFPITDESPSPGAQHESIEDAMEAAAADGTRSILDVMRVAETPDLCVAAPVPEDDIELLFGSARPPRDIVENNLALVLEDVQRGQCIFFAVEDEGGPALLFAGYSFD